jgi:predicted nucleic-acid-binding protein
MWITFLDGNEVEAIIHDIFCEMEFCDRDFGAKVALIEFVNCLMSEHRMLAEFICSLEDFQVTLLDIQEARANDEL